MKSGLARQSPSRKMQSSPSLARMPRLRISPPRKPRCSWRTCLSGIESRGFQLSISRAVSGPEPSSAITISKFRSDCAASARSTASSASSRLYVVTITETRNALLTMCRRRRLGQCFASTLVLHGFLDRAGPFNDCGSRMTRDQIHQDHLAAALFHQLAPHDLIARIIGTLDEHRRPHPFDQFQRRVLVENDDKIDRFERCEHFGASLDWVDRTAFAFQPRGGCVAVKTDHEPIASGAGFGQQLDVTAMQQIEAAVGEPDAQSMAPPFMQALV